MLHALSPVFKERSCLRKASCVYLDGRSYRHISNSTSPHPNLSETADVVTAEFGQSAFDSEHETTGSERVRCCLGRGPQRS